MFTSYELTVRSVTLTGDITIRSRYGMSEYIKIPLQTLTIPSFRELIDNEPSFNEKDNHTPTKDLIVESFNTPTATNKIQVIGTWNGSVVEDYTATQITYKPNNGTPLNLAEGEYKLVYYCKYPDASGISDTEINISYYIAIVKNKLPLKKWTITDCVNRCLELAEPLRTTSSTGLTSNNADNAGGTGKLNITSIETPRFIFDGVNYDANGMRHSTYAVGSQAEKYDKVIAPEFAMTKSNLREQLQQIGGFIHAEPRLKIVDGKYIIVFDEYGKREYSPISKKRHITKVLKQSVNDFCTELDSTVDNLVNRLAYAKGVMVEPYTYNEGKALRAESVAMRINDENGYIPTQLPIDNKFKLEINAPTSAAATSWTGWTDITDYLFEKADYDNMSSIRGVYPYSKAFALYYTQGEKGVRGLFFKNPDVVSQAWFQKYAIINILEAVGKTINTSSNYPYASIEFRISYIPRYSARVRTSKQLIIPGLPSTLAYNQGANLVETRYYGENLKGVVARLGNVEKTLTYKVGYLTDIPKAGQMFDKNYYISAVEWEIFSSYFKVTIGLSKDFNRLSEYVGISSVNRMYQVSEKQAQARDSVFNEYILVTYDNTAVNDDATLGQDLLLQSVNGLFAGRETPSSDNISPQFCVLWGLTVKGEKVQPFYICLPVCISAMGNSFSFSVTYDDNYSAGQKASELTIDSVKSMWGEYVPYNDYYGRFYWLNFAFMPYPNDRSGDSDSGANLPQRNYLYISPILSNAIVSTVMYRGVNEGLEELPILYRKESTEVPSITYEASFVTDDDNTIIGSGFARNLPIVRNSYFIDGAIPMLYIFDDELPVFEEKADLTGLTGIKLTPNYTIKQQAITFDPVTANKSGKSWAIVTVSIEVSETVENENGNIVVQTEQRGCDIILGRNIEVTDGQTIELPRLVLKRKLY